MKMEMPEFKPVVLLTNDGGMPCGNYPINELVEYHHTRIVEALKAENEELRKERDELALWLILVASCLLMKIVNF